MPWGDVKAQIFGDQSNRNSTPILCIHGHLDNSNSFKPLAEYLCKSNEYHMIAIDLPGHGLSSPIPNGVFYTPKLFLTVLRRIILHLHLKNFLFLGHSYGCGLCYLVHNFEQFQFCSSLFIVYFCSSTTVFIKMRPKAF